MRSPSAVLIKWLPLTQIIDPASPKCIPLYEAMAHYGIPLLCHTGGEKTLHAPDKKRCAILQNCRRRLGAG